MRGGPVRSIVVGAALAVAVALVVLGPASSVRPGSASTGTSAVPSVPTTVVRPDAFPLGYDGISTAAISLNWTASTAADFVNYTVYYSNASASGPWRFVTAITTEATTTVGVENLGPGETYWWNVTAYSTGLLGLGGTSAAYSSVLEVAQPTLAYLTSPAHTSSTINLTWSNNASYGGGISFGSYRVVEVSGGVNSTYENLTTEGDNATEVSSLQAGFSYSFYIETFDACSNCVPAGDSVTQSNVLVAGTAASLVVSVQASRTTVDTHLLVNFVCTPAGGTPPYAFGWNFTNGTTYPTGPSTVSHAFDHASASGYPVTCQVTDHTGHFVDAAPVTVFVNRSPKVVASATPVNVTAGTNVAFACKASYGTSPLAVSWTLGDGAVLPGSGDLADGNASYPSNGTYVAHCVATDAVGGKATASVVISVSPAPAHPWFTATLVLGLAAAAGAVVALAAGLVLRRRSAVDQSSAMARWLPPTGPAAFRGAKICPKCGMSNVPLRRTCQACGSPLPRHPGS